MTDNATSHAMFNSTPLTVLLYKGVIDINKKLRPASRFAIILFGNGKRLRHVSDTTSVALRVPDAACHDHATNT